MDTRTIDEQNEEVSFNLLQEWLSKAFRRHVDPGGDSWGAVAMVFNHDGVKGCDGQSQVTERDLRKHLVSFYRSQNEETVKEIILAKCTALRNAGGGVFLQLAGYEAEQFLPVWPWYLYCLTVMTEEQLPEDAVRMPLDMVDLQVLSMCFKIVITVSQLMQAAVRLDPADFAEGLVPQHSAHLLHHRGYWCPLLGSGSHDSDMALVDALVELRKDTVFVEAQDQSEKPERHFLPTEDGTQPAVGMVVSYDRDDEAYFVRLGLSRYNVERDQIARVLYHPSRWMTEFGPEMQATTPAASRRQVLGAALLDADAMPESDCTELRGLPDQSLEWQVLHELVRREARAKLEAMLQQLAGRDSEQAPLKPRPATSAPGRHMGPVPSALRSHTAVPSRSAAAFPTNAAAHGSTWPANHQTPQDTKQGQAAQVHNGAVAGLSITEGLSATTGAQRPEVDFLGRPAGGPPQVLGRLSHESLKERLDAGDEVVVLAVADFRPLEFGHLPVSVGEPFIVGQLDQVLSLTLVSPANSTSQVGWCPSDALTVWEVQTPFKAPPQEDDSGPVLLDLEVGDSMVVHTPFTGEWQGWAYGRRWNGPSIKASTQTGAFPLGIAVPKVLVAGWEFEL